MRRIEMTNSSKPLALGHKDNAKVFEKDVDRLEKCGFQKAEMPKPKTKREKVKDNE